MVHCLKDCGTAEGEDGTITPFMCSGESYCGERYITDRLVASCNLGVFPEIRDAEACMNRRRNLEREAYWRGVIREQESSGLSASAFCREKDVSVGSFFTWRRKLADRDHADSAAKFVPVEFHSSARSSRPGCEVILPNGCRLIVASQCDATWLHEIIRGLQYPSC
jgi:hypothetical protein